MRSVTYAVLTLFLAFVTTGCGADDGGTNARSGSGASGEVDARAPGSASGGEGGGGDSGRPGIRGDTVEVYMTEYDFDLPRTIPAGRIVFEVHNIGFEVHNFEIPVDDGTTYTFDPPVNPGVTEYLEAELEPGEYQVICTFSDHEGRGMITTIDVVP